MSNMRMKHKLIMSMMAGMIIIPGSVVRTQAAETDDSEKSLVPVTGIENILEASYQTEIKNNINLKILLSMKHYLKKENLQMQKPSEINLRTSGNR